MFIPIHTSLPAETNFVSETEVIAAVLDCLPVRIVPCPFPGGDEGLFFRNKVEAFVYGMAREHLSRFSWSLPELGGWVMTIDAIEWYREKLKRLPMFFDSRNKTHFVVDITLPTGGINWPVFVFACGSNAKTGGSCHDVRFLDKDKWCPVCQNYYNEQRPSSPNEKETGDDDK